METRRNVFLDWVKDCKDEEEKEKRRAELLKSKKQFEILAKILESKMTSATTGMADYTIVAWPYKTADTLGYNRAMNEVLTLIKNLDNIDPNTKGN